MGIVLDDVDFAGAVGNAAARVAEEVVFAAGFVVLPLGVIGNERSCAKSAARAGCMSAAAATAQAARRFVSLRSGFTVYPPLRRRMTSLPTSGFSVVLFEVGTVLGGCVAVGGDVGEIDHQAV
ncbi:hypothetical protein F9Z36_1984 [Neisseria gonorrhoeae]|nr:hypothetical protein F9Z36_1984 [Neisseria gonorrhoeae]